MTRSMPILELSRIFRNYGYLHKLLLIYEADLMREARGG